MSKTSSITRLAWLLTGTILLVCAGCTHHDYVSEMDQDVYRAIDNHWQDSFGPRVNYRITEPVPLPPELNPDQNLPSLGVLTLPQAVALATARNRDYQAQKETLYTKAMTFRVTRHDFEYHFLGGLGINLASDSNDALMGYEANVGFNRLLTNGMKLSARVTAAWVDILTGNLRGGITSILGVTMVQPLLRGSDPNVVMERLTQTERDTLYQIRTVSARPSWSP